MDDAHGPATAQDPRGLPALPRHDPQPAAHRLTHVVVTGEPGAGKPARRVREGDVGKGPKGTSPTSYLAITTCTDLTGAQVVACANDRCNQENVIAQLKNGVNALRVPLYDLISNWAYMVIAALAWNIKSWYAMMLHHKDDRREYIGMEFRRFITSVILIPATVTRHARNITIRLVGYTPSLGRFFSAWNTIERTGFD